MRMNSYLSVHQHNISHSVPL